MFQYLLQTALHWAAKHGKEDMTTVLAEAGADINTKAVSTDITQKSIHFESNTNAYMPTLKFIYFCVSFSLTACKYSSPHTHPGCDSMHGLMFLTCVPSFQKVCVFKTSASDITPLKGYVGAQLCK